MNTTEDRRLLLRWIWARMRSASLEDLRIVYSFTDAMTLHNKVQDLTPTESMREQLLDLAMDLQTDLDRLMVAIAKLEDLQED